MRLRMAVLTSLAAVACGGSGGGGGADTVTFTASGASPTSMQVGNAATVTFKNSDTVAHGVASSNCAELAAASIAAGASVSITMGQGLKTCNWTDPLGTAAGTIQVAAPGTPGY
jgi:hypothetical protein